jgi:hypothetical protein
MELLERRMLCLGAARAQLDSIVQAGTAETLPLLAELDACADVATLAHQAPLPTEPTTRAAIERAYVELAAARVSASRHDLRDPIATGDHVLASATATRWPPIVAAASRVRAELVIEAGQVDAGLAALQDAASVALSAGDDREAAWAMSDLARVLAHERKPAEARSWLELARAIWQRTGKGSELGARIRTIADTIPR